MEEVGGGGDGGKREQEREWRREGDYSANSHTLRFTTCNTHVCLKNK